MKSAVLDKLLDRLDQIEPGELQGLLSKLVREKGLLQKVFEALREGVLLLDSEGQINFINAAGCRFFGTSPDQAQGESIEQTIRGLEWSQLVSSPRSTVSRDLEVFYPENRYLNFYLSPVAEEDDADLGYVMLVRDVTRSKAEAEEELESEKINALTLLAAGVAHEIGNPLNSLSLHLQLLERRVRDLPEGDQQSLSDHLGTARNEIERLDTILKQFLQAMRPTTPVREAADRHDLLEKPGLTLKPELETREIAVQLNLADELPSLSLDAAQIQQALYNLIRNAYQAISPPNGEIVIQSVVTEYEVTLSISDNGSGISPEMMGAMFEPFQTTKNSGTGLGMLIVRRILREHGGELEVESEENVGTKVSLFFPRTDKRVRLLSNQAPIEVYMKTLLIVDDEKATRDALRMALEESFDCYLAADLKQATLVLKNEDVDLLLTDLRLGGDSGMEVLDVANSRPNPPVSRMVTAYGSVDTAVEAMRRGAWHFVTKPLNLDEVELLLKRAVRSRSLEKENKILVKENETLRESGAMTSKGLGRLIGSSAPMAKVTGIIEQIAQTRATVLIEGESGTGKEVVAHVLHDLSGRPGEKFVAVNCAALSPQPLESELFGHETGAFTGATQRRVGRFEQAHGGTLFLDEIGEIDSATQVKLLRALSERTIERVGSNTPVPIDVRIITATNKHLTDLVAGGEFREDLFFRLNVLAIHMPPLRERREDIVLLANAFLQEFAEENGRPEKPLTEAAMTRLISYNWPGNVRELRTAIEHAVVMSNQSSLDIQHLPEFLFSGKALTESNSEKNALAPTEEFNLHTLEQRAIHGALTATGGNRTKAAELLGISRRTLQRKLRDTPSPDNTAT